MDYAPGDRVIITTEDVSNDNHGELKFIIEKIKNYEAEHLATVASLNKGVSEDVKETLKLHAIFNHDEFV